ncbi:hypothetical protein [Micromonospora sp. NPDC005220]|uniref:hypothetical protein n=1 Tax=Micromonospora sp. NPDC005220 TaxID=3155589 RepID=UPI0033A97706
MGVEERLKKDAEALARAVARVDKDALLARTFDALDEGSVHGESLENDWSGSALGEGIRPSAEPVANVALGARLLAAGPPAPPDSDQDQKADAMNKATNPVGELVHLLGHVRAIAPVARRIAEILELLDRPRLAWSWWNLAAEIGDADAIEYVSLTCTAPDQSIPTQRADNLTAETRKLACEINVRETLLAHGYVSSENFERIAAEHPIAEWLASGSSDQRILELLRGPQTDAPAVLTCRYGFASWVGTAEEAVHSPSPETQVQYPKQEESVDAPSVAELEDLVRW